MNQQKWRPLLLVIPSIPLRLQNPPLDLPLRTVEVEFFSGIQGLTLQLFVGKPRELTNRERLSFEVLGIVIPGIVGSGELIESTDNVDIAGLREGALRIQETAAGQGLNGTSSVLIGEFERRDEFLIGTRLRSRDREHEDLDTGLASGGEIDVPVVLGKLHEHVSPHGV